MPVASCFKMQLLFYLLCFFYITAAFADVNVFHLHIQGEEGDQGGSGEVGSQGPMVGSFIYLMILDPFNL